MKIDLKSSIAKLRNDKEYLPHPNWSLDKKQLKTWYIALGLAYKSATMLAKLDICEADIGHILLDIGFKAATDLGLPIDSDIEEAAQAVDIEKRDEKTSIVTAKWTINGAKILTEAANKLRAYADELQQMEKNGWQLTGTVEGDYGFIEKD